MEHEPIVYFTLGKHIRRRRKLAKLSQLELAENAGLNETYISDLERGIRNPSYLVVHKIARGLGITLSELSNDVDLELADYYKNKRKE